MDVFHSVLDVFMSQKFFDFEDVSIGVVCDHGSASVSERGEADLSQSRVLQSACGSLFGSYESHMDTVVSRWENSLRDFWQGLEHRYKLG
jgi:hypothetical protein